ncbi:MAG: hypothetical protein J5634_02450 [Bacilli bacterium]|nr:hypothetical protein [Bacilli bacterium]
MLDFEKLKANYESNPSNRLMENLLSKISVIDSLKTKDLYNDEMFNIELTPHGMTDQYATGRCWIFSYLNYLREIIIYLTNMYVNPINPEKNASFELSANYLAYYDKLEKINFAMDKLIEHLTKNQKKEVDKILAQGVFDGGDFNHMNQLINKYGIVPARAYNETITSISTYEINAVLDRILGSFYLQLKSGKNPENVKETHIQAAYNLLTCFYGQMPEKFDFKFFTNNDEFKIIRDLTPKRFYEILKLDVLNEYVEISSLPENKEKKIEYGKYYEEKDSTWISGGRNNHYLNLRINRVKQLMLQQLKNDLPVCFDIYYIPNFYEGKWKDIYQLIDENYASNLSLGNAKKPFKLELNREQIIKSKSIQEAHAMLLTGASKISKNVDYWKVENSWGEEYGYDGFIAMSDDFMTKYFMTALIDKTLLSKKEQEAIKKRAIKVKDWE